MGCGASSSQAASGAEPSREAVEPEPSPSGTADYQTDAAADTPVCEAQPASESGGSARVPTATTDAQGEAAPPIGHNLPEPSTAPAPPTKVSDTRPQIFSEGSHVLISGIEKRPELNGQMGVVTSYEGGTDRRYTVRVLGSSLRLRESKLAATVASMPETESCDQQQTEMEVPHASSFDSATPPCTTSQKYADFSYVMVSGIEKKPELNGQVGLVVSFEGGADRRYTVKIADSLVSLRECKLVAAPTPTNLQASSKLGAENSGAADIAATMADEELDRVLSECREAGPESARLSPKGTGIAESNARDAEIAAANLAMDAKMQAFENYPTAELTAKGALIPTYQWQKVPQIASLPPGLEVWMPMNHAKCARIPATWRMQVIAEGQVDAYRCDVGEHTLLSEVLEGAVTSFGWGSNTVRLCANGIPLDFGDEDTVGSALLFGQKMTARKEN